ncbi:MAG: efflux RND transporter permease subunit [Gammaproteobacteria bacterium]|jgi:multidrug efflux pump|nr:efflux RND transporter permease subunit [Gammaproteobacteria bacterium]
MILSDISVRRPVFAAVLSLIPVILGLLAVSRLAIREFPNTDPPVVTVTTVYRGASAEVVERRVTQVIEDLISGISGVQKLTSSSQDERSNIVVEFSLDRDPDGAANDVRERVARVQKQLPDGANPPEITKQDQGMDATLYIGVDSQTRTLMELTDYAERNLVDRLSAIDGVATIRLAGAQKTAMRIWLNRDALAARGLTVEDVENTLRRENVELPAGRIESRQREFSLRTATGLDTAADFEALVIGRGSDNYLTRLGEVARVRIEPEDARFFSRSNGVSGISLGIVPQANANILEVNRAVLAEVDRLQASLPADLVVSASIDFSRFIEESMIEVVKVLFEALLLVLVVIFAFVGSLRATIIPALTIPVAIISSFIVMAALGYTINTLTLLGLVLAIGLVVDDAIVVLENIVRKMELGRPPLLAAIEGSQEIGFAVISTTAVLVAVFVPISFMPGNIGRLFGEFGISLAAAIAVSGVVALSLVPMLTSLLYSGGVKRGQLATALDRFFQRVTSAYRSSLARFIGLRWVAVLVLALVALLGGILFSSLPGEYAPSEDRNMILMTVRGPEGASPEYMDRQVRVVEGLLMPYVEAGDIRRVVSRSGMWGSGGDVNTAFIYMPLVSRAERERSSQELSAEIRTKVSGLPGVVATVFLPPSLAIRSGGAGLAVVLSGTTYEELTTWQDLIISKVEKENPRILGMRSDFFPNKPKIRITVDRDRAADLGVSLQAIGSTLETMLGSRIVTSFVERGEEYNVILQGEARDRETPSDLQNIYVRSERSPQLIPLASLVRLDEMAGPKDLKRFNQLRSVTLTASLAPGYSIGEAVSYMEGLIARELPPEARIDFDGEAGEYKRSGNAIYLTFGLAMIVVFLILAAQFESFKHPLIIMLTVPMAITGGLVGLWVFGSSVNVYSQIGGIMLIGLAAKNGILIVEFANQLRDRGTGFHEAIISAASIRLRPVLMTSLCTAFGAVPLMLATGAGTESRRTLGATVFFGVTISVFLTLYLIPAVYALLARRTQSPEHISRKIARLQTDETGTQAGSAPTG